MGFNSVRSTLQYHFVAITVLCKRDSHIHDPGSQTKPSVLFICNDILYEADTPASPGKVRNINSITSRYDLTILNCTEVLNISIILDLFPDFCILIC